MSFYSRYILGSGGGGGTPITGVDDVPGLPEALARIGAEAWDAATAYTAGTDIVSHGGVMWNAVAPVTGSAPGAVEGEWREVGSSTAFPEITSDDILMVHLFGQSNGVGWSTNTAANAGTYADGTTPSDAGERDVVYPNCKIWTGTGFTDFVHSDWKQRTITRAADHIGGFPHVLAKYWPAFRAQYPNLPETVYIVPEAIGGASITYDTTGQQNYYPFWPDPQPATAEYAGYISKHRAAYAAFAQLPDAIRRVHHVGLWVQGESDTISEADATRHLYASIMRHIVTAGAREWDLEHYPVLPIQISSTNYTVAQRGAITGAMQQVLDEFTGAVIPSGGLDGVPNSFQADNIHYNNGAFEAMTALAVEQLAGTALDYTISERPGTADNVMPPIRRITGEGTVSVSDDLGGRLRINVPAVGGARTLFDFDTQIFQATSSILDSIADQGWAQLSNEWSRQPDPERPGVNDRIRGNHPNAGNNGNTRLTTANTQEIMDRLFAFGGKFGIRGARFASGPAAMGIGLGFVNGGYNGWGIGQDIVPYWVMTQSGDDFRLGRFPGTGDPITIPNNAIDRTIISDIEFVFSADGNGVLPTSSPGSRVGGNVDVLLNGVIAQSGVDFFGTLNLTGTGWKDIIFLNSGTVANVLYLSDVGFVSYGILSDHTPTLAELAGNLIIEPHSQDSRDHTFNILNHNSLVGGTRLDFINGRSTGTITLVKADDGVQIGSIEDRANIVIQPGESAALVKTTGPGLNYSVWSIIISQTETQAAIAAAQTRADSAFAAAANYAADKSHMIPKVRNVDMLNHPDANTFDTVNPGAGLTAGRIAGLPVIRDVGNAINLRSVAQGNIGAGTEVFSDTSGRKFRWNGSSAWVWNPGDRAQVLTTSHAATQAQVAINTASTVIITDSALPVSQDWVEILPDGTIRFLRACRVSAWIGPQAHGSGGGSSGVEQFWPELSTDGGVNYTRIQDAAFYRTVSGNDASGVSPGLDARDYATNNRIRWRWMVSDLSASLIGVAEGAVIPGAGTMVAQANIPSVISILVKYADL